MTTTIKIYPKVWLGIYKVITEPTPLAEFPERVKALLLDMVEHGLLNIIDGNVTQNHRIPDELQQQLWALGD